MTHATREQQASGLQESLQNLAGTVAQRAMSSVSNRLSGATERLTDYAEGGGGGLLSAVTGVEKMGSPIKSALSAGLSNATEKVKESLPGMAGSTDKGGDGGKITNIVEQIDVGVPIDLAYKQWTEFAEFPKFMKKVENVEQVSDEKLRWQAQIFWSHRTWESKITEQIPNDRIIWRSQGDKGFVDGAVTFHELAPDLTRVIVVLEYHPKGFFERTGNLWRAQGRRARLELKNFQRHVMAHALLHPDEVEGWKGEIRGGEVVPSGESKKSTTAKKTPTARPRKAAAQSSSGGSRRSAAKATTSRRRPAAKAASSGSSGRKQAAKGTGSARTRATKATSSSRRRSPAKKRS